MSVFTAERGAARVQLSKRPWLVLLWLVCAGNACAQSLQARILMQSSPLAGFRHYEAPNLWGEIQPGDPLVLVREPGNPHDRNAVRVEWRTFKLGYVPRAENQAVALQLDRGSLLVARVSKVQHTRAPNQRIELEIYWPL